MVNFKDLSRCWFFVSESATYQLSEDGERLNRDYTTADQWLGQFASYDPVYRYFWSWSLSPVTFTSRFVRIRDIGRCQYQHFPAVWLEDRINPGFSVWIEVFKIPAPYLSPDELKRLWAGFGR